MVWKFVCQEQSKAGSGGQPGWLGWSTRLAQVVNQAGSGGQPGEQNCWYQITAAV